MIFLLAGLLLAGCAGGSIKGPANQYLPYPVDLPGYLVENDNLGLERLVEQSAVRVLPQDSAFINFDNAGYSYTTEPQNGTYLRLAYWVLVMRTNADAETFYRQSNQDAEMKTRLSAIMPSTIQQTVKDVIPVVLEGHACQDAALYKIPSKVIFTPDLYLYATCRIENAVILVWAYTPDNYDGNNAPIPDEVIADQMKHWVGLAAARVKK